MRRKEIRRFMRHLPDPFWSVNGSYLTQENYNNLPVFQSTVILINIRYLTTERSVIGDADFTFFACMDGGAEQTGAALPHIVAVCVGVIYLTGEQTWFTSPRIVPVGVKMNHTAVYCAGHGRAGIIAVFIEMDFVTKWAVNGRVYLVMAAAG